MDQVNIDLNNGLALQTGLKSRKARKPYQQPLEIWAGVEPTVNRVGDTYFDQLEQSGHSRRLEDLDLFAGLGIRTLRYPVLWDRIAPDGIESIDWTWTDERFQRLRELGIRPIVGLIHHGSGPRSTHLLDHGFPEKLAVYARLVAERYPWIDAYTPVNEPLTTARFSALYGIWYPHEASEEGFALALYHQVRAIQLAMQAIRQVNPAAQLVTTEDLGKTFCTPQLENQADYENTRRWLSLDLLTGRVTERHTFWELFRSAGVAEKQLEQLAIDACRPDIAGFNYYITSERFLDERLENYPPHLHGGNGYQEYVDVEVTRVCKEGISGVGALLKEAWERYHLPLALTEVHLGSTRDEQLRWLVDIWEETRRIRRNGIDVRALTAWALLGSYNWNSLVTRDEGYYESGIYDVRSGLPRPTILTQAVRRLAAGKRFNHPVLDTPGWWRRPDRLLYPAIERRDEAAFQGAQTMRRRRGKTSRPKVQRSLLIVGKSGTLAGAFGRLCEMRGLAYQQLSRHEMDITRPEQVEQAIETISPWAVVNTAGYVRVDEAEQDADACRVLNTEGARILAKACASAGIQLVTYSSDLVFDGQSRTPYVESSPTLPLNVYGQSKADAEIQVLASCPNALVVRTSAFFGPWDRYNFPAQVLQALSEGRRFQAVDGVWVSPTYVPDLVNASLDLLIDGERGIWHLANQGAITWYELACQIARLAGKEPSLIERCSPEEMPWTANRPRYSVLGSERGLLLPPLEQGLDRFVASAS